MAAVVREQRPKAIAKATTLATTQPRPMRDAAWTTHRGPAPRPGPADGYPLGCGSRSCAKTAPSTVRCEHGAQSGNAHRRAVAVATNETAARTRRLTSSSGDAYLANVLRHCQCGTITPHRKAANQRRLRAHRFPIPNSQFPTNQRATSANASRAAASVASITAWSCALDMKPASYAEGARYTPRCSIAWKKRLKLVMSHAVACA